MDVSLLWFMKSETFKPGKITPEEEEEYLQKLAKRIRNLRKERGYTNYEYFAYDVGISRAQYGKYEAGANIKFNTLLKIIKGLGMTVEEFFSEGFDK